MTDEPPRTDFALRGLPETGGQAHGSVAEAFGVAQEALSQLGPRALAPTPLSIMRELGGLLTVTQAAESLGQSEEQVEAMVSDQRLLVHVGQDGVRSIPGFQLTGDPPRARPEVPEALALLQPVCLEERSLLLWFCAPKDELSGSTPASWLRAGREPEPLLLAAKRDAARLA
jgi:hypothetical protein